MLRPKSLMHVGILVDDLDKSIVFYQKLGLELLRSRGPNAEGVRSAVIKAGDQELNLFSRTGLVSNDAENLLGMHHYCLSMQADSIEQLMQDLRQAGIAVVRGPVERSDGTSVFVHDPDGVRVEMWIEKR